MRSVALLSLSGWVTHAMVGFTIFILSHAGTDTSQVIPRQIGHERRMLRDMNVEETRYLREVAGSYSRTPIFTCLPIRECGNLKVSKTYRRWGVTVGHACGAERPLCDTWRGLTDASYICTKVVLSPWKIQPLMQDVSSKQDRLYVSRVSGEN